MLMDRHLIKDIRLQLEYRYFVEEVTDNYIVFIKIDDENEVRYKVFGIKCPECGEPIIHEGGCDICKACGWSKCG